jgi:Leucine-rich repeat (LRR) protein
MPLALKKTSKDRINFEQSLTSAEIESLMADSEIRVLQTSNPVKLDAWDLINEKLLTIRPDIELRVYGFYSSDCDLSFLSRLENVRRFSADCLMKAHGIEHLSHLKNLERLSVGIYSLDSFDFLAAIPSGRIRELSLCATRSKRPSLELLERFTAMETLYLEGQQKEIETLSRIKTLEKLTLRSISTGGLAFLRPLTNLWSLDIKLGGTTNLSALEGMNGLKYLELWQVKGLSDISVIGTMSGLQYIFLQALRNVRSIPNLAKLTSLRRLYLENMKGLDDVSALGTAPALEEFVHVLAQNMEPEQYEQLLKIPTLRRVMVGFGSAKKNRVVQELLVQRGIEGYKHSAFKFV